MSNTMNAIQYHLIKDNDQINYDNCWETGNYVDQDCDSCPHHNECSGYEDHDKD
jgi:hypothetical protein